MPKNDIQILLVEDNPNDAELTLRAFKKNNLANQVHWVKDGEELMEYLNGPTPEGEAFPKPGMILLDLNMPKKDEREALKEIKSNPHLRRIPVIIMTTSKADSDITHSYDLGVNSFIQKPVRFFDFVKVIKNFSSYWFDTVKLPL